MNKKKIWITWHYSARSRNLANELNLNLNEFFVNKNAVIRHSFSSLWTIGVLLKRRPKVICLQLSFMLLLITALYKSLMPYKVILVADCHTKALRRKSKGPLKNIFWKLKKFGFSKTDLAIVSNEGMKKDIEKLTDKYIFLPDKIPSLNEQKENETENYCVYISSFAVDEPVDEIFDVAKLLDEDLIIYWTGKTPDELLNRTDIPSNIRFTGFISFEEYYELIGKASAILALTTEADCLQSGAYEALAVETPMVISDTKALREYFSDAAIYTKHDPVSISNAIIEAIKNEQQLINIIRKVKSKRNKEFEEQIQKLKELIK